VGDERAETYLRVLAESELRRTGDQLRRFDAAAGTDVWSRPDMSLFATVEGAQWKVVRTEAGPPNASWSPAMPPDQSRAPT
jgi:hypothetical protein